VLAVDVGGFPDSLPAARLRDSLAAAGWESFVSLAGGNAPWRVRVAPSRERLLVETVAAGLAAAGRPAQLVVDTVAQRRPTVQLHPVNRGTHGMRASLRWSFGEDRRAIVAVEDPVSVEGDALPNGFVLADERWPTVVQRDSVWDVAPSPDWRRVAFGRAFIIPVGGRDAAGIGQWFAVARRTNLDVESVRRGAFPVSGMSDMRGFAQPVVEPLGPDSTGGSLLQRQVRTPVPLAGGWRVRWSQDGRTLAVGLPPRQAVRDDAPASSWLAVDARSFVVLGELQDYVALASPTWVEGPTLELESVPDSAPRRLEIAGGTAESADGWIVARGTATRGQRRVVGPGALLAVTRDGHFLLAVAPAAAVQQGEPRSRAVLYQLSP
jgi:hypothetical protein